jgi:hypothetical protein
MTKTIRRACALGSAVALLLTNVPAIASTFLAMEMPELVEKSDVVIRGEVLETRSFWDAQHRVILTDARIRIDERLSGEGAPVGREISVRTFGGTVADYTVVAHGFPTFEKGDEIVAFLAHQPDRTVQVTGYQLGLYEVIELDGARVAVPTWDGGSTLLDRTGKSVPGPEPVTLEDLRDQLRFLTSDPY